MMETVTVKLEINLPGHKQVLSAEWPVANEPIPHRQMVANVLQEIIDELRDGV